MPEIVSRAKGLSKEQKIGFILLLIFAILTVGLGLLQIRNTMYSSFSLSKEVPATVKDEIATPDALHYRDTDLDGLNDFDELYVYETSPYLADSDSDGLNDRDEITQGKNPLCMEGRDCSGAISNVAASADTSATSSVAASLGVVSEEPVDLNAALQDPSQIRQMLKAVGVADNVLNSISDIELLKMVDELMATTSTANANLKTK